MLDTQGVVDLLLELDVRVGFVKHDNGSVKAQVWPPHTGEANALPRSPSVFGALGDFNFESL